MKSQQNMDVSQSTLPEEVKMLAVRLAEALGASSMSAQQKEAWAVLIPEMRLDQLARFAEVLDASVSKAMRAEVADIVDSLRKIFEVHAAKQAELDSAYMTGVSSIVQRLRAAEANHKDSSSPRA
jgi:hypothetical protein